MEAFTSLFRTFTTSLWYMLGFASNTIYQPSSFYSNIYPLACGQVKLTFIPAPGKVIYTKAKVYHPFILLYFMQKTMQKLVARNIRDESLGYVSYIYNNLPTNQGSKQKLQCTM